jgi:ATPase family AAA domain-containing protein 2
MASLLNNAEPPYLLDESLLEQFNLELVTRSSGLSVEQLEQVNAALMDSVWKEKGEWNRNSVMRVVKEVFNQTIDDIQSMQIVFDPSQRLLRRETTGITVLGTQTTGGPASQISGAAVVASQNE